MGADTRPATDSISALVGAAGGGPKLSLRAAREASSAQAFQPFAYDGHQPQLPAARPQTQTIP